jgi:hypothetical protein
MSRFYNGQPVVCVWDWANFVRGVQGRYGPGRSGSPNPGLGQNYHVVRSLSAYGACYVTLRERPSYAAFVEDAFEPLTENAVRALEAIATDVPEETRRELERETRNA